MQRYASLIPLGGVGLHALHMCWGVLELHEGRQPHKPGGGPFAEVQPGARNALACIDRQLCCRRVTWAASTPRMHYSTLGNPSSAPIAVKQQAMQ